MNDITLLSKSDLKLISEHQDQLYQFVHISSTEYPKDLEDEIKRKKLEPFMSKISDPEIQNFKGY